MRQRLLFAMPLPINRLLGNQASPYALRASGDRSFLRTTPDTVAWQANQDDTWFPKRSDGKVFPLLSDTPPFMQKCCLVLIPPGFEEIEVVTPVDVLRRGKIKVVLAAVEAQSLLLKGKHQLELKVDCFLEEVMEQSFAGLVLPGGPGMQMLLESQAVLSLVKAFNAQKKTLGAICAAPLVLYRAGILEGRKYTAHFSVAHTLTHIHLGSPVIVDNNLITANGPGAALPFGLELLKALSSEETAQEVAKSMCYMAF